MIEIVIHGMPGPQGSKTWVIYTLASPSEGVRYVGVTSQSPDKRLDSHLGRATRGENTHKDRWLRKLLAAGVRPSLAVVASGSGDGWKECEQFWISTLRAAGCDLTNSTAGGEGSMEFRHSESSKRLMSSRHRGKVLSSGHRLAISLAVKGRMLSPSHRKALKGRRVSPTGLKNMRESHLGQIVSKETRDKISLAKKGISVSGKARIGKALSKAHRAAIASGLRRYSAAKRKGITG